MSLSTDLLSPARRPVPPPAMIAPAAAATAALAGVASMRTVGEEGNLHDRSARAVLLDRIAALLGVPVAAPATLAEADAGALLLVPGETVVAPRGTIPAGRLLGGLVPARFVATKAIAHGLIDAGAQRPALWNDGLADTLGAAVLRGATAFSVDDARRAGRRLLADGAVRLKDTCGKAGLGQVVVADAAALDAALAGQDADDLADHGLVLEENLVDVVTYSVGATTIGGRTISYWGTQSLTRDHRGREVYGGSDLRVVRGDLDALAARDLPPGVAAAVMCAALFDRAVQDAYPDAVLTRRNYDVIEGTDAAGRRRIALLEQSWRIGGASGAELMAMAALRDAPGLAEARCATVEIYGEASPPPGATVYFAGIDPVVGPMAKYAERRG